MPRRWEPICAGPAQLVRPVGLDATGQAGPTRGQARGKAWRRTTRGFYVPASTDSGVPEQRIIEQSMPLGGAGAVTAWASLRMHRAGFFDGLDRDGVTLLPVPLISPDRQLRPLPGRVVCQDRLAASERVVIRGVPCTEARRATFDEMRRADLRSAVTALDMAAAAELTSVNRMRAYLATRHSWNGGPLVADALELADERSRSPGETRMRLIWILDAGLPRPVCNRALFSLTGELLGVPDLLDVEAGVVGEYDGADHLADNRRYRDLGREGRSSESRPGVLHARRRGHARRRPGRRPDAFDTETGARARSRAHQSLDAEATARLAAVQVRSGSRRAPRVSRVPRRSDERRLTLA